MKLGYHILAFINLNVLPEDKQKFYHYAEGIPNILECSSVTGEYSVIMKVAFESTMQLDSFLGQLQKFGKTSTQVVFAIPCRSTRRAGTGIRYIGKIKRTSEREIRGYFWFRCPFCCKNSCFLICRRHFKPIIGWPAAEIFIRSQPTPTRSGSRSWTAEWRYRSLSTPG